MENQKIIEIAQVAKENRKTYVSSVKELKNSIIGIIEKVDEKYTKTFFSVNNHSDSLEVFEQFLTIDHIPLSTTDHRMTNLAEKIAAGDYKIAIGANTHNPFQGGCPTLVLSPPSVPTSEYNDNKLFPLTIETLTPKLLTTFLERAISYFGLFATKKEALDSKTKAVIKWSENQILEKKKEIQKLEKEVIKLKNSK